MQGLSHTKLFGKVFMIYLIAIPCIVKKTLNPFSYIPKPENDNEINVVWKNVCYEI